jgi:hypothetical protein
MVFIAMALPALLFVDNGELFCIKLLRGKKMSAYVIFVHAWPTAKAKSKSCLHLSVLLLGGLYTNLEEF